MVEKGAEAHVGSLEDENFLTQAFTGAEAVYVMIPPNFGTENLVVSKNTNELKTRARRDVSDRRVNAWFANRS